MKITVFYSWQSDSSRAFNRDFIEEAANLALAHIDLCPVSRPNSPKQQPHPRLALNHLQYNQPKKESEVI
jgi:hypothetical protein